MERSKELPLPMKIIKCPMSLLNVGYVIPEKNIVLFHVGPSQSQPSPFEGSNRHQPSKRREGAVGDRLPARLSAPQASHPRLSHHTQQLRDCDCDCDCDTLMSDSAGHWWLPSRVAAHGAISGANPPFDTALSTQKAVAYLSLVRANCGTHARNE
jgi:hypothetical protein